VLHGIPILVKDNINTGDRMTTTAGSLALEGNYAEEDASIIKRLRDSGAVIIGKTNLSEWANFRSTMSVSGWSSRGGLTKNPYVLDRSPWGSSSGSGASVAANLCSVSIGTETDGSIVWPAAACGIVGIKPTVGFASREGIIPISQTQDTPGPMARTVADAAILLQAISGTDKNDPATGKLVNLKPFDYSRCLDSNALRGVNIGIARAWFAGGESVTNVVERCMDIMKSKGAKIVDDLNLEGPESYRGDERKVLQYEFKDGLNRYLQSLGPNSRVRSIEHLIAFNEENKDLVMPYFGQERVLIAASKGSLKDREYLRALKRIRRSARDEGLDRVMNSYRLDAIIFPTGGLPWKVDLNRGDPAQDYENDVGYSAGATPAAVAGYPHITVPAGFVNDCPIGMSFVGAAWSEEKLIRLAYAFEQATKARREPKFLPCIREDYKLGSKPYSKL